MTRRTDIVRHFDRWLEGRSLLEATQEAVNEWLDAVPRVARTRYSYLSAVYGFYCWCIEHGHTTTNPAAGIPRPKLRPSLPRPIHPELLARALREAPPMIRCWLLLGSLSGLRCQEMAGLAREDVWDHEDPALLHVIDGKGGVQRMVPLHPAVLEALRAHGLPRTGPLFRSPSTGRQYRPERLSQIGNRWLRSVGIDACMHQLRHRFGTDIYRASRDLRLTQSLLGHASPVTTAIYTAVSPVDAARVVAQLRSGSR